MTRWLTLTVFLCFCCVFSVFLYCAKPSYTVDYTPTPSTHNVDEEELFNRLQETCLFVEQNIKSDTLIIDDLGDFMDGWDGETTRKGHKLPQNMDNQKAFDVAGVKSGQTIVGGEVETKNGILTGVLIDNAKGLVYNSIPAVTKQTYTQWLQAAQQNCFAQGLTTITDCGLDVSDVNFIDLIKIIVYTEN